MPTLDLESRRGAWCALGAGIPAYILGLAFLNLMGCLPAAQGLAVAGLGLFPTPPGTASSLCCNEQGAATPLLLRGWLMLLASLPCRMPVPQWPCLYYMLLTGGEVRIKLAPGVPCEGTRPTKLHHGAVGRFMKPAWYQCILRVKGQEACPSPTTSSHVEKQDWVSQCCQVNTAIVWVGCLEFC